MQEITLIDLIESLLLQAHEGGQAALDYEAWSAEGAPDAPLRAEFAGAVDAARERRPEDARRLDDLAALYAEGKDVDPLVAIERERVLSSGDKALLLVDGRHRTFAAADAGVDRLPVFVVTRGDAVFSY